MDETLDWKLSAVDIVNSRIFTPICNKGSRNRQSQCQSAQSKKEEDNDGERVDETACMLRSVLKEIAEPQSEKDVKSFVAEGLDDTDMLMEKNRRQQCLPNYIKNHLVQIKNVVTNFVSTWRLPF